MIKLKWALGGDEWITFDQRAHAGERLDKLCREVGMAASAEYHQIGSYRGFQIFAQRRPFLSDALFPLCANRSRGPTWDPELRCTIAT